MRRARASRSGLQVWEWWLQLHMPVQEPRRVVERYAAGDGGAESAAGEDGRAFVSINWVLSEAPLDLETELAWGFLDYLLLGTSAPGLGFRS